MSRAELRKLALYRQISFGLVVVFALLCAAALFKADAAEITTSHVINKESSQHRLPLALRTLSRRSASVLASTPCWRGCTSECGWHFQSCLRADRLDICLGGNNQCELSCLRQCRPLGGPLVSWTDY
jgi:hypothetical protein